MHTYCIMKDHQMEIKLEWHNTDEEIQKIYQSVVIADIQDNLEDLEHASSLIFHHVFVGEDMDGPHVFVWGKDGSDAFQCEYHMDTKWESISDLGDDII